MVMMRLRLLLLCLISYVWTGGSLVLDQVTGVAASGAGFFSHSPEDCWRGHRWGHVDRVRLEGLVPSGRGFCSVPGPAICSTC